MMVDYDLLMIELKQLIKDSLYVEDEKLYVKCQLKYNIINLMDEYDNKYMKELYKELEYDKND